MDQRRASLDSRAAAATRYDWNASPFERNVPRMRTRTSFLALTLSAMLALGASSASAKWEPTDHAMQAMQKGDYKTALKELQPLAEKGDEWRAKCGGRSISVPAR